MQPRACARWARSTLDRVAMLGECDFVSEIAAPFPLEIIGDMMGLPSGLRRRAFELTQVILGISDPEYFTSVEGWVNAALELNEIAMDLGERRLANPGQDLISTLMHAEVDGERLTSQEFGSFFILMLIAGNETTRNAISHGLKALTDHPYQRRIWLANFDRVAPTAVEEILRWATPVHHFRRTASRDTVIGGQRISEGDKVVLWYLSANRDETKFEDPQRFDVLRAPNEHVAFGAGGPHFCLGAHLARREIRIMFEELFARLPDIEVTGQAEMLQSAFVHGIKRMPCAFTPA